MHKIFLSFFLGVVMVTSLLGLGFELWTHTEGFREFAEKAMIDASAEAGEDLDYTKGRSDLRTAGLLIFITMSTLAWLPVIAVLVRYTLKEIPVFDTPSAMKRWYFLSFLAFGIWIKNLSLLWL